MGGNGKNAAACYATNESKCELMTSMTTNKKHASEDIMKQQFSRVAYMPIVNENLFECSICGTLIVEHAKAHHLHWHTQLARIFNNRAKLNLTLP